jgi:hypothetical protein
LRAERSNPEIEVAQANRDSFRRIHRRIGRATVQHFDLWIASLGSQ